MKKVLTPLLLLFMAAVSLRAQDRSLCVDDSLRLTTGYDRYAHTLIANGQPDPNWTVLSGPGASQLSFPSPAFVVPQYSGWHYTLPNSMWLSPFGYANYGQNNFDTPYVFRYSFCLAQQTVISLFMEALDDDLIAVYLDGQYIDSTNAGYNFYSGQQDTFTVNQTLYAGTHNLDVRLYNVGGIAMGLNVQGYITSLYGLQTDTCCFTNGSCNGSVYRDHNGDGNRDQGTGGTPVDEGLPGWNVDLTDGNNSFHRNTDIHGDYSFMNIAPGSYNLQVSNPSGSYYSSTPVTIGKHTVSLKNLPVSNSFATAVNDVTAESNYLKVYPNPSTTLVSMDYYLSEAAPVTLHIDNIAGQTVMQVLDGVSRNAGTYHQSIDISQLPAGVYIYELNADRTYRGRFIKK
ncbi:MAG: T9SS type A sorting domain-containing protein [Bacteroidetes bacterium]|nr:T9SS type A sorting domain-containing protein [Bacteroidota bacterium]